MIRHELTPADMLRDLADPEHLPERVGLPTSDVERAAAGARLRELAHTPDAIRTRCIACEADCPILETAICICGGFVCEACQRVEEDGCNHTRPAFLPAEDDEDE